MGVFCCIIFIVNTKHWNTKYHSFRVWVNYIAVMFDNIRRIETKETGKKFGNLRSLDSSQTGIYSKCMQIIDKITSLCTKQCALISVITVYHRPRYIIRVCRTTGDFLLSQTTDENSPTKFSKMRRTFVETDDPKLIPKILSLYMTIFLRVFDEN